LLFNVVPFASAHATDFCVDNVTLLKAALSVGEFQSAPYKIKIEQGTYLMNADSSINFSAQTTIEGGYTVNCAARVVDAANTVIDIGQPHSVYWHQDTSSPEAQLNLDGMTFRNASTVGFFAGAHNQFHSNDPGSIDIRNTRLTQIYPNTIEIPVAAGAHAGPVSFENVQVDHVSTSGGCGIEMLVDEGGALTINHTTADLQAGQDFCLSDNEDKTAMFIYNSILWSSGGGATIFRNDGSMNPNTSVAFFNDIYAGQAISGVAIVQNPIFTNPMWIDPANGNYRLKTNPVSPAINTGTTLIAGGEPATDIEGHIRVIGSAPDRGAYESAFSDQSTLVVTNTFDSGPGSLRQAMLDSNSSFSFAKSIEFDIRNQNMVPLCPAVIALSSSLPVVATTMKIDGYTQAGSTRNTDASAFNANLCVMIKPVSGTLPTGLRVLSSAGDGVSLTLRGVGLGGFGQPLVLLGGQSHVIAGNQFGGVAHGVSLPGAAMSAINVGVNATGSLIIGGNNAADRNVIGGADTSGVSIQPAVASAPGNCQIVNNLIGLAPNGVSALANAYGIQVSGSGCMIARNRVAGNTIANLYIQGNSNVAQQNLVGFNIQNDGFFTNTIGMLISGSGNTIGAGGNGGSITANSVRYNIAGGIVVKGDSAIDNSINANRVYDNGNSSDAMDIDLLPTGGVAGPTPNDAADLDSGPNDLQNFPVPKSLVYTAAGTTDRPGTVAAQLVTIPGTYRVDVYFSNARNSLGNRGHAEIPLTHATVQVPAGGKLGFSLPVSVPNQSAGGVISMSATNSSGSTSEIGTALSTDSIFVDGLE
ncbi:MAG: choice-of-anchor Q domain-containing protein, partial [Dokdonella sp.]